MTDAINKIVGTMDNFPAIYKISIVDRNHIIVHWTDTDYYENTFDGAVELLEWCEKNLESNLD